MEDIVIFLTRKLFNSDNVFIAFYTQELRIVQVTLAEKLQMKMNILKKQEQGYLVFT